MYNSNKDKVNPLFKETTLVMARNLLLTIISKWVPFCQRLPLERLFKSM